MTQRDGDEVCIGAAAADGGGACIHTEVDANDDFTQDCSGATDAGTSKAAISHAVVCTLDRPESSSVMFYVSASSLQLL